MIVMEVAVAMFVVILGNVVSGNTLVGKRQRLDVPSRVRQTSPGRLENCAYVVGRSTTDSRRWPVGLDVHSGAPLFAPVGIDPGPHFVKCSVNP